MNLKKIRSRGCWAALAAAACFHPNVQAQTVDAPDSGKPADAHAVTEGPVSATADGSADKHYPPIAAGALAGTKAACNTCGTTVTSDRGCGCWPGQYWGSFRYAYIWTEGYELSDRQLRSGTFDGGAVPGVDNSQSLSVFGGEGTLMDDGESGFYTELGYWLDCRRCFGVTANFFYQPEQDGSETLDGTLVPRDMLNIGAPTAFPASDLNGDGLVSPREQDLQDGNIDGTSDGGTTPISGDFQPVPGATEQAFFDGSGAFTGTSELTYESRFFGGDVSLIRNLCSHFPVASGCGDLSCDEGACDRLGAALRSNLSCFRIDMLSGFRYFRLEDELGLRQNLTVADATGTNLANGDTIRTSDRYDVDNDFYGGMIGLRAEAGFRRGITLSGLATLGIGATNRSVERSGETTDETGVTTEGGLFTASNREDDDTDFSLLPRFGGEVGYFWNKNLRLTAGYDLLLWSDVARAGQQLARGAGSSNDIDDDLMVVQAFRFGSEYRW